MINLIIIIMIIALVIGLNNDMKNRLKLLWFRLLGKNHNQNNEHEIQFSELTVTGNDKTEIQLPCVPKMIKVEFQDLPNKVPCNPHHDKLSWDIKKVHGKHFLVIKWHVSGLREIKWFLFY